MPDNEKPNTKNTPVDEKPNTQDENKPKYRYIYRDAESGQIVTEEYALANLTTTVRERREIK
jgi:hypothetical protein